MFGDLSYQRDIGMQTTTNDRVDMLHVCTNQSVELIELHLGVFPEDRRILGVG
jgi:hypothetical protein